MAARRQAARDSFAALDARTAGQILAFLESLVAVPARRHRVEPGPRRSDDAGFPQRGHGNIRLPVLFLNPSELE